MTENTHGKFPVESQRLLDYISTPALLTTESRNTSLTKSHTEIDTDLHQNDVKLQTGISEPAFSARQMSEYHFFSISQTSSKRSSKDTRPRSFSSWRGLLNIQDHGAQQHVYHSVKPGMRPLFGSLLPWSSFGNSSQVATVTLDASMASVSHSSLDIKDIPTELFNDIHRDSLADIRKDSFRNAPNGFFKDTSSDSFTDVSWNSFTEIASDSFKDITSDWFSNVSIDTLEETPDNVLNHTQHSDSLKPRDLCEFTPGVLLKYRPGYLYKDIPGDTAEDLLNDFSRDMLQNANRDSLKIALGDSLQDTYRDSVKDISRDSPKDSFRHSLQDSYRDTFKDSSRDSLQDTLRDSLKETFRDSLQDSCKDSLKDNYRDLLQDSYRDSLVETFKDSVQDSHKNSLRDTYRDTLGDSTKDTQRDSLKHTPNDLYNDVSSNYKKPSLENTFDVKLPAATGANSAVYLASEHHFLETSSCLIQHEQSSTAKQETSLPPSITLSLLGIIANLIFIGPLVVAFWDSTWSFFDYSLQDHDCQVSVWTSAAIGFPCMAFVTLFQGSFLSYSSRCNRFTRVIFSRMYTYVVSVACVNQWRSTWFIADCYVGSSLLKSAVTFCSAFILLLFSRCLVSACAPPVFIDMEVPHVGHYKVTSFRGCSPTCSFEYLLDTVISVFGVHVLVILYWRAFWEILDYCLIPDDKQLSALCSVGMGIGLSCILLISQRPILQLSRYLRGTSWLLVLMFQDLITVMYSIVCITYWRGLWMLLDLHTPFRPTSLYIVHGASFTILAVFLTSNSLLVRNVDRDGAEGVIFDVRYVITLVQTLRHKTDTKYRTELVLQRTPPDDAEYL